MGKIGLEIKGVKLKLVPSPLISSLHPTLAAVDWSAWVWNEGNFAFFTTIRTDCLVHLFTRHIDYSTPSNFILCKSRRWKAVLHAHYRRWSPI